MKKLILVLLSVVMLISCFYGCSKQANTSKSDFILKYTLDSHYSTADEATLRSYEKFCSAVENGEPEVKISASMIDAVTQLFYTCFPLYPLVKSMTPLENGAGFSLTYTNDIDTHNALVSQFKNKISDIMNECSYGKVNVNEYIFNVYTYITQNFTLDNNASSTFDTIINSKGHYSYVNSAFEYLVLQGGGRACHVVNYDGASTIISTVKFNDEWYFFDPATEISESSGKALKYFAMNNKDVKSIYSTDSFLYTDGQKIEKIKDDAYKELRNSTSFTADNSQVKVTISGKNDDFIINFK